MGKRHALRVGDGILRKVNVHSFKNLLEICGANVACCALQDPSCYRHGLYKNDEKTWGQVWLGDNLDNLFSLYPGFCK